MDPDHVMRTLKYHCSDKQNCPISANRVTFGDDMDPSVAKYLRVWYECIPDHRGFVVGDGLRRYRRDVNRYKTKREFFLPVTDAFKEKSSREVKPTSEADKGWDKSNEQTNKTSSMASRLEKRQDSHSDKLSHILSELLHPESSHQ